VQRALQKTTQVVGNCDVRVGRFRGADIGSTDLKRGNEPSKLDCEQSFVQSWNQCWHVAIGNSGGWASISAADATAMLK
jgi:hypothetical protein